MKNLGKILMLGLFVLIGSCSDDDEETVPVTVTTADVNVTIIDNVSAGDIVGVVTGTSNMGAVTFAISSQNPTGALAVNATTGQLTVADASLVDAAVNPEITAAVSVTSGEVSETANVTVTVGFADFDGDGVLSTTDADDMDPCSPAQDIGYTGFDASNMVWAAADCDGDGTTNGDEVAAGTGPYDENDLPCDSADTSVWAGDILVEISVTILDSTTEDSFGNRDDAPITATCGVLVITDPINFGPCAVDGDMDEITYVFTPSSDGATDGTVEAEAQVFLCNGDSSTFSATGTYDEVTGVISMDYVIATSAGFNITGTHVITAQ